MVYWSVEGKDRMKATSILRVASLRVGRVASCESVSVQKIFPRNVQGLKIVQDWKK